MADIPNFQFSKVVDEKGFFTPHWQIAIDQLLSGLQTNFGPEGVVSPPQSSDNIALLDSKPDGTIIYNSTDSVLMVKINGVFKQIQTL